MRFVAVLALLAVVAVLALPACTPEPARDAEAQAQGDDAADAETTTFRPLRRHVEVDVEQAALGRELFFDKRLSADDTIACVSCHDLARGGVDHKKTSVGINGQVGPVNAPTVFNASLNFAFFWNGRAATLEEQAGGPPLNPGEMGSTWPLIIAKLDKDDVIVARFARAFPNEGITSSTIERAIAMFERTLITPDAPFDRFLRGDHNALSDEARSGFELFQRLGCVACHQGQAIGGNMFQRFGVMGDYFKDRGHESDADLGRYAVTHLDEDRHVFKVPSLRNVALTAPYFHDGSAPTLDVAVRVMARYQLGHALSDDEARKLVAFLESLTGRTP